MKIQSATTSLALAIRPIPLTQASTSLTREVDDSTHENNRFVEKHNRLTSTSSVGDRFLVKERALPDVGVLERRAQRSNNSKPLLFKKHSRTRFLQDKTCLKPDTCEPKLCACVANSGDAYECAHELHAVCQGLTSTARNVDGQAETWTIDGCVDEKRVDYYTNLYCPFAGCLANGGTYNQCSCDHFYKPYCELYGTTFAESETVQLYCEKASCCSAAGEDDAARGICLLDDASAYNKLSEDSSDPSPLGESPGPLTIPNSVDQTVYVPNQALPNQVVLPDVQNVPNQDLLNQDPENGAITSFTSFGLSLVSTFAIVSAFLFIT